MSNQPDLISPAVVQSNVGSGAAPIEKSTAKRVLPLQGGLNFRDMGGYRTEDGRQVKWGKLFRSGRMIGLTPSDYDYLSTLGIRTVFDLRTRNERTAEPSKWVEVAQLNYVVTDHDATFGELRKIMTSGYPTAERAKEAMIAGYRALPYEHAPAYRALFAQLSAGEIPLVFNCAAGKDRTGTAAALILTALGVDRETVVADYALSEQVVDFRHAFRDNAAIANSTGVKLPPEAVAAILRSDPDYIHAAFASIEDRHRSIAHFLTDALGVSERDVQAMKELLLE